jgi:hypothetical protein
LIAHQQQHVIESAMPILTPQRHTPILSAHPTNPVQARRNRATSGVLGGRPGPPPAASRLLAVLTDA